jgi:hypothetical protein
VPPIERSRSKANIPENEGKKKGKKKGKPKEKKKAVSGQSKAQRQREAVSRYRHEMRKQGMKLVQFWAPDVNAPGFAEECLRQSLLAAADSEGECEILAELEAHRTGALQDEPDFDWGPQGPPR